MPRLRERLPQCERVTDKVVSCADWCYGVPDAKPPNHVCYDVFIGSIDHYIAAHLGLDELECGYSLRWPAPIGVQTLKAWYEGQRAEAERLSRPDDWTEEAVQRWESELERWARTPTPDIPPVWGAPPVSVLGGEYWLGFVVHRPVADSSLWLLGLLGRPTATDFTGHNWFKWIHPVLQIESRALNAKELNVLARQSKALLSWYNETVFGETTRKGGPVPLFTTQAQCRTAVVNAYRALLRGNPRPTRALVAQRLGYSDSGLRDALTGWGLKWKDLVAEARAGK